MPALPIRRTNPFLRHALVLLGSSVLCACSNVLTRQSPQPSTPEAMASMLVMRVNHALMSAEVPDYANLRISATDGAVVLEGAPRAQEAIDRVIDIARQVDGVETATYRVSTPR